MSDISASFISIDQSSNITSKKSYVQQLVDILQTDISAIDSSTRKMYEVFVTGGQDQNTVKSSLYHTIYDQDFELNTSNPLFDITLGLYGEKQTVGNQTVFNILGKDFQIDSSGKIIYNNSEFLMVREKNNIYRQYAQNLLGDPDAFFVAPFGETYIEENTDNINKIKNALFINFRRLFVRDNIFKGSFGMNLFEKAQVLQNDKIDSTSLGTSVTNIKLDSSETSLLDLNTIKLIDDVSQVGYNISPVSGEVSTLLNADGDRVGLIFYDKGVIVLDVEKCFNITQKLRGLIESISLSAVSAQTGPWAIKATAISSTSSVGNTGSTTYYKGLYSTSQQGYTQIYCKIEGGSDTVYSFWYDGTFADFQASGESNLTTFLDSDIVMPFFDSNDDNNVFYSDQDVLAGANSGYKLFEGTLNDLCLQATLDDILDHFCMSRFGNSDISAIAFRNETVVNSSFIFCRAAPSQLNYSTNPTYTDENGQILAVDASGQPFAFVTTIGLYDTTGLLVAVAKTSRPIEKNLETDLSIRIRLDY